jgi:hypothetical protein
MSLTSNGKKEKNIRAEKADIVCICSNMNAGKELNQKGDFNKMALKTDYTFVCFTESSVNSGRWVCKARLRGEIRLGYIEYSTQFNRFIFVSDKSIYDANYLAEIIDFINQLEEQKGLIN